MKRKHCNGFSLLELLLVLAIVSLVGLSSLYSWQRWQQHQRMLETAQRLQQFLHGVRAWANWHNSDQPLWLLPEDPWCLGSGAKPPAGCQPGKRMQLLAPHAQIRVISLSGEPGFYGRRNVAKAGHITFGDGTQSWRVIISARGRIRLCTHEESACL